MKLRSLVFCFGVLASVAFGQYSGSWNIQPCGSWFEIRWDDIAIDGDYAYMANGTELAIYNFIEPDSFALVSVTYTGSEFGQLEIHGDYLFGRSYTLLIYDVSVPGAPILVSSDIPVSRDFIIHGDYLYTFADSMRIYDISVPESPMLLSTTEQPPSIEIKSKAVEDDYVFFSCATIPGASPRLEIFDVSDHAAPFHYSTYTLPHQLFYLSLMDTVLYGIYLGIYAIDVSDIDSLDWHGEVYPSYPPIGFYSIDGDYLASTSGTLLDISDPFSPVFIDSIPVDYSVYDLVVHDELVFMDGNYNYIVDFSDTSDIHEAARFEQNKIFNFMDVEDGYAYVTGSRLELGIFDVSDPTAPFLLTEMIDSTISEYDFHGVVAHGDYVFTTFDPLRLYDVTDREAPLPVWSIDTLGIITDIDIVDDLLYMLSVELGKLFIFDITDIESPEYIGESVVYSGSIDDYYYEWGEIDVVGDTAYIGANDFFTIVDVSDPASPHEISSSDGVGLVVKMIVEDGYAWCARDYRFDNLDLKIIDVHDPMDIHEVEHRYGSEYLPYFPDIEKRGNYLFCINYDGFLIYDVSDPTNMIKVAYYNSSHFTRTISLSGDYAYVTGDDGKLYVFDISDYLYPDYTTNVAPGWNLFSWPFEGTTPASSISGSIIEPVFRFDPDSMRYLEMDSLTSGEGYWALATGDTAIDFSGSDHRSWVTINLKRGWNMIGGPYVEIPVSTIDTMSILVPPVYGFEGGGYVTADTLYPFLGYWILANDTATVDLPVCDWWW